ncbi:hypothetical protein LTS18_002829 [Coniosporium uncinatum]|uniref:Uncharacterized protein n=1 Tax=Coniosporium uncinatum TaxID=93489 RepID=A0ACC3D7G3_9PEZI|nr:hypothetical protein LTS18_002829 [Coniosporium uncinatum]
MSTWNLPPLSTTTTTTSSFPDRPLSATESNSTKTSVPPINTEPVELDSTPVSSPIAQRTGSWTVMDAFPSSSPSATADPRRIDDAAGAAGRKEKSGFSPDLDDVVYGELSGERGVSEMERAKRAALLNSRSKDPAVLVDIPQVPAAEELAAAAAADPTPAVEKQI